MSCDFPSPCENFSIPQWHIHTYTYTKTLLFSCLRCTNNHQKYFVNHDNGAKLWWWVFKLILIICCKLDGYIMDKMFRIHQTLQTIVQTSRAHTTPHLWKQMTHCSTLGINSKTYATFNSITNMRRFIKRHCAICLTNCIISTIILYFVCQWLPTCVQNK